MEFHEAPLGYCHMHTYPRRKLRVLREAPQNSAILIYRHRATLETRESNIDRLHLAHKYTVYCN